MAKRKVKFDFVPSKYQEKFFDFIQHGVGNAVIEAAAGSGKCLGFDTEILMYDGSIKKVQDIKVGDLLMGDDSQPRKVLSTKIGEGRLKRIVPKKGNSWVCNDVHILTLDKYQHKWKQGGIHKIVDISIDELNRINPAKHKDGDYREYKLLKTGVEFSHKKIDFDPWLYGIWLGDGSTKQASITNIDNEIIDKIKKVIPNNHYVDIKKYKNKTPKIDILSNTHKPSSNKFRNFVRKSSNEEGKFIIKDYLINDKENRLKLLAGIIDSDGYLRNNNYYIATKFKTLCDDIIFLARSLGFGAYYSYRNKTCYNNGVTKKYYHITINGDLSQIPVVLPRKKAGARLIAKNPLHVGFRIDDEGYGKYYGFTLDGNGRFLLGDFTITHNTSTCVAAMKLIPKDQKCLFIAFNKSIADELNERLKSRSNCVARTTHSLGFLMLRRNLGSNIEVDEYKYRKFVKNNIGNLTSASEFIRTRQQVEEYIDSITMLIDFSRFNLAQSEKEINEVAQKYSIPVSFDECAITQKCLEWGKEHTETIDYTDMVWLPVELSLAPIGLTYDWVFFDEAQDASLCTIQLFLKCIKRGGRFVSVGDQNQSVNLFAGSSEEAFNFMKEYPNTTLFELPISYRCAKNIVTFANQLVPNMFARDDAPDGIIVRNCHVRDIKEGDMVLCRSKAPLVKLYVKLLRKNINCYIKGQDIGTNLIKELEKVNQEDLNTDLSADGVFVRLWDKFFTERNKLMQTRGLDYDDATLSSYMMDKYDAINTLMILAEKYKTKTDLIKHIKEIFQEDSKGVCLSTIHKAKGFEAENVYILCHSTMPSKLAVHNWEKLQEQNLMYVAYTRAKNLLGFVSEKEIKPSGTAQEPMDIINELSYIERKVCEITGKQPMERLENADLARFKLQNMTKLEDLHENDNTVELNKVEEKISNESNDLLSELENLLN